MNNQNILQEWLIEFDRRLQAGDVNGVCDLFLEGGYWRDYLAFTWNIKTCEGRDEIAEMLRFSLSATRPNGWQIVGNPDATEGGAVEAELRFETELARGRGYIRVVDGKCLTLLTTMDELKGHEEPTGFRRRALGSEHQPLPGRKSWRQLKAEEEQELGRTKMPYCVIVGGGQAGVSLAARLKMLDVPTIVLERNARAGDAWRARYESLILHDPVWYDHLPYIPFPNHWPVFTPKDMLADWLEMYVKVMGLNYWTNSECQRADYDAEADEWVISIDRDGSEQTLRCKHLVFATGGYGPPKEVKIEGMDHFRGVLCHSSQHRSGARFAGKKCVVVGSNSSAHDICVDLWESGADVTMIQRSATTVIRSKTLMKHVFGPYYSEEAVATGISTEAADLRYMSLPFRLMAERHTEIHRRIAEEDAEFYRRLGEAGFLCDFGPDGSGLIMKGLRTGSGYYIDVGGSDLIADGEIKLRSGVEPVRLNPDSMTLSDGCEIPADLVVYATGYESIDKHVATIVGEQVSAAMGRSFGYGSGVPGDEGPWVGELRNVWKPTPVKNLWLHGGNLHLARQFSRYVALQLKARMEGIPIQVFEDPNPSRQGGGLS